MEYFGHRHLQSDEFLSELRRLRLARGFPTERVLERLEKQRLVIPKLRVRYPDAIARRLWRDANPWARAMHGEVEPDGKNLSTAQAFREARFKHNHKHVYGPSQNPLDDIEPRFKMFVTNPAERPFVPWESLRVDVSNDVHSPLYDSRGVETLYTSWQTLIAAEVDDLGVHLHVNLADERQFEQFYEAIRNKQPLPDVSCTYVTSSIGVVRRFGDYSSILDAVVWFTEESQESFANVARHHTGRFQLSDDEAKQYVIERAEIAHTTIRKYCLTEESLAALLKFLANRWDQWTYQDRALIAEEYRRYIRQAAHLAQLGFDLSWDELGRRTGQKQGRDKSLLDAALPDWAETERERTKELLTSLTSKAADKLLLDCTAEEISAFLDFLNRFELHSFFWRLKSFEQHAFEGNEFALSGMRSDLQGMALVVEHVARALGGEQDQLYKMFKKLWRDSPVVDRLKDKDVWPLALRPKLANSWPDYMRRIEELRAGTDVDKIVSDLVLAHRLRGSVHFVLSEADFFALERLFVVLLRAAVRTFVHRHRLGLAVAKDADVQTNESA